MGVIFNIDSFIIRRWVKIAPFHFFEADQTCSYCSGALRTTARLTASCPFIPKYDSNKLHTYQTEFWWSADYQQSETTWNTNTRKVFFSVDTVKSPYSHLQQFGLGVNRYGLLEINETENWYLGPIFIYSKNETSDEININLVYSKNCSSV